MVCDHLLFVEKTIIDAFFLFSMSVHAVAVDFGSVVKLGSQMLLYRITMKIKGAV